MSDKFELYWVETGDGKNANAYLWWNGTGSSWGISPLDVVLRCGGRDPVTLQKQKEIYPEDTFTLIGEGTAEECFNKARAAVLIGIGDENEVTAVYNRIQKSKEEKNV